METLNAGRGIRSKAQPSRQAADIASPALARMLDPDITAFIAKTESFYPASANQATPAENRATYDRMCAAFHQPRPPGVRVVDTVLVASGPWRELVLRNYSVAAAQPGVALLYLHGGGYVVGGLESHDDICAELCAGASIEVAALDYRLAPEHAYPAALDDAEAAYRSLIGAGYRVIVGGDSAGGALAAALCLRLMRLNAELPCGQVLIYPGLGGDPFRSGPRNLEAPLLRAIDSGSYRDAYAGGKIPDGDPEFAPLCASDLRELPQAAIFSAGIDPLRQDSEDYAALLMASGVPTAYRNDPGLVHGYLRARHASRAAGRAFDALTHVIASMGSGLFIAKYWLRN